MQGTLVYIDKSPKYMYQLDSRVRMINMPDYPINDTDELIGFLCGVISQNNSIEKIFIDSFLTLAYIDTSEGLRLAIDKLSVISKTFHVNFVLSISQKEEKLPEELNAKICLSL